jgi:hypothetical protein
MGWHELVILTILLTTSGQGEQNTRTSSITVSGCVTQAEKTGSLADDARAGVAATPNTAPVDANSAQPIDAYLLTNAFSRATTEPADQRAPTSYALQGREQELSRHKGHRVEVTGQLLPERSSPASAQSIAPGIRRISVQSVKMLSAKCPADTR